MPEKPPNCRTPENMGIKYLPSPQMSSLAGRKVRAQPFSPKAPSPGRHVNGKNHTEELLLLALKNKPNSDFKINTWHSWPPLSY